MEESLAKGAKLAKKKRDNSRCKDPIIAVRKILRIWLGVLGALCEKLFILISSLKKQLRRALLVSDLVSPTEGLNSRIGARSDVVDGFPLDKD